MYAKNHENLGHGMCHPLPGFSLDGLLIPQKLSISKPKMYTLYNIIEISLLMRISTHINIIIVLWNQYFPYIKSSGICALICIVLVT